MPDPTFKTVTPSGVSIEFFDGTEGKRRYLVNGNELPSVTTILGILDKPALVHWGQKIGVTGAIELARTGELPLHPDGAISRMKARGLCFWQVSDRAADRGTLAHEDLLKIATGATLPLLEAYPVEQRGFIQGVASWFADQRPETIDAETMVASLEHGFAGRYDLRARLPLAGGKVALVDLKTTQKLPTYKSGAVKPPYTENVLQLEAYDIASRESGYGEAELRVVVRVDATGEYSHTVSWAQASDFLGVLAAHRAIKSVNARKPKAPRAQAAA